MCNGPIRNHISTILINNGINNVRNRDNMDRIVELQSKSMDALQEACPRAHVIYSMPLKRSRRYELDPLGHDISDFCYISGVDFIFHSLSPRFFSDEFHLTEEGTRAYVANIHRHLYGPKGNRIEQRRA